MSLPSPSDPGVPWVSKEVGPVVTSPPTDSAPVLRGEARGRGAHSQSKDQQVLEPTARTNKRASSAGPAQNRADKVEPDPAQKEAARLLTGGFDKQLESRLTDASLRQLSRERPPVASRAAKSEVGSWASAFSLAPGKKADYRAMKEASVNIHTTSGSSYARPLTKGDLGANALGMVRLFKKFIGGTESTPNRFMKDTSSGTTRWRARDPASSSTQQPASSSSRRDPPSVRQ